MIITMYCNMYSTLWRTQQCQSQQADLYETAQASNWLSQVRNSLNYISFIIAQPEENKREFGRTRSIRETEVDILELSQNHLRIRLYNKKAAAVYSINKINQQRQVNFTTMFLVHSPSQPCWGSIYVVFTEDTSSDAAIPFFLGQLNQFEKKDY